MGLDMYLSARTEVGKYCNKRIEGKKRKRIETI